MGGVPSTKLYTFSELTLLSARVAGSGVSSSFSGLLVASDDS